MKLKCLPLLLLSVVVFVSCQQRGYTIIGTVAAPELEGKWVYLEPFGVYPKDSLSQVIGEGVVINGEFLLSGAQEPAILAFLHFEKGVSMLSVPFVLENGTIRVSIDTIASRGGTPENDEMNRILMQSDSLNIESYKYWLKGRTLILHQEKEENRQQIEALGESKNRLIKVYIHRYPDRLSSAYLLMKNFYSLTGGELLDIYAKAGPVFCSVPGISTVVRADADRKAKIDVGKKFIDFEMPGVDGKLRKLSDYVYKNKYTLIDFWHSQADSYLDEIPGKKEAYRLYRKKGFEIVGVSLDNNYTAWVDVDAIEGNKLEWPQLCSLTGPYNEVAELYFVRDLPHTVLIDQEGTIVENGLRGEALTKKLGELL